VNSTWGRARPARPAPAAAPGVRCSPAPARALPSASPQRTHPSPAGFVLYLHSSRSSGASRAVLGSGRRGQPAAWAGGGLPPRSVCGGQPPAAWWVLEQPQRPFLSDGRADADGGGEPLGSHGTGACWVPSLAGLCCVRPSLRRGFPPQSKVPRVPGASQCLLVTSLMTMPSASTAMAAAATSPRRMISSLVAMAVAGGDVAGMASWGSSWYLGPSILVMPVSMTPFCTSTPAARRTGQHH